MYDSHGMCESQFNIVLFVFPTVVKEGGRTGTFLNHNLTFKIDIASSIHDLRVLDSFQDSFSFFQAQLGMLLAFVRSLVP